MNQILDLHETFVVHLAPSSTEIQLSDVDQKLIESIWLAEQKAKGFQLFNGTVLSALSYSARELVGQWIPYKWVVAAIRHQELAHRLHILPVGVSGLTLAGQRILVGERSLSVTQNPGCLELAPAGSLDPTTRTADGVDFRLSILQELRQETGIESSQVRRVEPFAIIREANVVGLDICLEIQVDSQLSSQLLAPTEEYQRLFWSPLSQTRTVFESHVSRLVSTSRLLLSNWICRRGS